MGQGGARRGSQAAGGSLHFGTRLRRAWCCSLTGVRAMPGPRALLIACSSPFHPCVTVQSLPAALGRSLSVESPFSRQHLSSQCLWVLLQRVGDGGFGDWCAPGPALEGMGSTEVLAFASSAACKTWERFRFLCCTCRASGLLNCRLNVVLRVVNASVCVN